MSDLVDCGLIEGNKQDDEYYAVDDRIKEDCKKNSIDVGFLELERKN